MANKRPAPEKIATKLWQVEVLTGRGMPPLREVQDGIAGISEVWIWSHKVHEGFIFLRWR